MYLCTDVIFFKAWNTKTLWCQSINAHHSAVASNSSKNQIAERWSATNISSENAACLSPLFSKGAPFHSSPLGLQAQIMFMCQIRRSWFYCKISNNKILLRGRMQCKLQQLLQMPWMFSVAWQSRLLQSAHHKEIYCLLSQLITIFV